MIGTCGWPSAGWREGAHLPEDDLQVQEDLEKNSVQWFGLSPVNNTYAIATAADRSEELGVSTLTDYAALVNEDPEAASLCAATEFLTQADGWPGVEEAYGFNLPEEQISEVDLGIVFTQVPSGEQCGFGEVFATDGRIPANDMVIVEDDQAFFVAYNLAVTARQDVVEQYPEIEEILTPVAEQLTTETMQELNAQVGAEGLPPEQVAQTWLEEEGFIG